MYLPFFPDFAMFSRKSVFVFLVVAFMVMSGYLLAAYGTYRIGFPLDDAWIHQTYARNLALRGEWAFVPGKPSAGSTAPLWTVLLVPGYWLHLSPYAWAFVLGGLLLAGLAWLGQDVLRGLLPALPHSWHLAGGMVLLWEWHLVWAAASGMETLLAAVWVLLALWWMYREVPCRWGLLGAFIGLGVWVRPDLVTLLGPAWWVMFWRDLRIAKKAGAGVATLRRIWKPAGQLMVGFVLVFVPYLLSNRLLAGAWWPNTFYAKQREYAALQAIPYFVRLGKEFLLPLVGGGALLLPGFVYIVWRMGRQKHWEFFGGVLWFLGYLGLYAWRLPVTYQHGRYIMPAMPVFFVLGAAGMLDIVYRGGHTLWGRVLSRVWLLSLGVVLVLFYLLGGRAYGRDVAVIESEMVAAARWVNANTPEGSLVAAHDIGALGYFGERDILDLAGLISPEVISFLRDEKRLAVHLDEAGAAYLVTFPGWYPHLTACAQMVYRTDGVFSPQLGGENMAVYRWRSACVSDK
ncbi:MAG: hypothetical protein D6755_05135 [Anaerolineae bacterium]|nr:MAG: hypothetical protein D6755_05135 [Anaerolineae bacterium]